MQELVFWRNKKVFITGHTGFKGSWLCLWLHVLGANVTGYALHPPTCPNMFQLCRMDKMVTSVIGDIRDQERLCKTMIHSDPDVVIHMAAQPLVRESYRSPSETYGINVLGTIYLLEAVRKAVENGTRIRAVVNVTSDKCYENREWPWGYRENDPLGGCDPYSSSKACSELITSAYRHSFFHPIDYSNHGVALASARAGNVIGGGDWAADRLIPDCIRSLFRGETISIRNPQSFRPWQHVLEPLWGYLLLARKLWEEGPDYAQGWNFGPDDRDVKPVEWVVKQICNKWGGNAGYKVIQDAHWNESNHLKLDCSKAKSLLGWHPKWSLQQAIDKTIEWYQGYRKGKDVLKISFRQIEDYMEGNRF